jgi:hypothetical protein
MVKCRKAKKDCFAALCFVWSVSLHFCSLCSPSRVAPVLGLVVPSTFATAYPLRSLTYTLIRNDKQARNGVKNFKLLGK